MGKKDEDKKVPETALQMSEYAYNAVPLYMELRGGFENGGIAILMICQL